MGKPGGNAYPIQRIWGLQSIPELWEDSDPPVTRGLTRPPSGSGPSAQQVCPGALEPTAAGGAAGAAADLAGGSEASPPNPGLAFRGRPEVSGFSP